MTAFTEAAAEHRSHSSSVVVVSAPAMKFAIGLVAALSAVFFPRLVAALTAASDTRVVLVSREYVLLALSFSTLVAVAVMILEWRVPRPPRDTFMTTLGLPAMLAGALSASQGTTNLQQAADANDKLAQELAKRAGVAVVSATDSAAPVKPSTRNGLADALVTPLYAESALADQPAPQQSKLGIYIDEPRYFVVLDRAAKREDAQARAADLTSRFNRAVPGRPLALEVSRQGDEFMVVVPGGPRPRAAALLEALRLKDTYHVAPTLVEARVK
jgi:hypothetical protein